ncbi:putative replicative DNA helicase [Bacillus phage SWEP1]|nr:putative replicative DNA helicase [Bacillus phage SWEP1]
MRDNNYYGEKGIHTTTHVINEDNLIYEITSFRQLQSSDICFVYNLELVAGYDYINPDYSDIQGYVSKENFVDDIHFEQFTFYAMSESLTEALNDHGYKVVNINDYKIHQFKGC